MKIGIVGTGRMGTAIARRLLELGHEVQVWNRTADNAQEARDAGAKWTPTLGELVNDSEVVISFLFDNAAVERVYLGSNGLVSGSAEGQGDATSVLGPPKPPARSGRSVTANTSGDGDGSPE